MRKIIYFLLLAGCAHSAAWAQYKVSGKVQNTTGKPILGATILLENTSYGAYTGEDGSYNVTVSEAGKYKVVASSIGSASQTKEVELSDASKEITVNFDLTDDAIGLGTVVVTGVSNPKSKLESSVSISTMSTKNIDNTVFRTTAELFRSIPGVRSESSGGEGNTNITVRGVPISAGGSKYVQLQEDGLPILMFGDIAFATSDIFLRADNTVGRIEAIRGGSASTQATNSPAGIINFISKTGDVAGGSVALTAGLDHKQIRTDFNYGTPLGNDVSLHVGGFYRQGEGVRTAGYDANLGGQFKANLTKRFENGYARVYYKMLNDRAAAYMPMPMQVTGTGDNPTWTGMDGFSATHGAMQSPYLLQNLGLGADGQLRRSDVRDGMHPVSQSIGSEFSFDLGNNWKVEDRARMSFNSGRFIAPFPAEIATGSAVAHSVAALRGDSTNTAFLRYTDGTAFDNSKQVMRMHLFDTELNNFNNVMNDFKISKKLGIVDINAGYFRAHQNINMSWLWSSFITDINGNGARLLNVMDTTGGSTVNYSDNGQYAYGVPAWGNCCQRNYNVQYAMSAPYAGVEINVNENLNLGGSMRWDMGRVTGTTAGSVQTPYDMNNDGVISAAESSVSAINNSATSPVNYKYNYLSYSFGGNYKLSSDMAVFARYSKGAAAKADRILFSSDIKSDGNISNQRVAIDYVNQAELGWKYNFKYGGLFVTGFYAKTNEAGSFEATTQKVRQNDYRSLGLEIETALTFGDFNVRGSMTYTNAKITGSNDTSVIGNRPRRQAPIIFNLNPYYTYKNHSIGFTLLGTASSYTQDNNLLKMPGYVVLNPYVNFQITKGLQANIAANNVLNSIGITEAEEGSMTPNTTNYLRGRPILGRSVSATIRYNF